MQSGSNWTKAVESKTGRQEGEEQDGRCGICNAMRETTDHVWFCPALQQKAKEVDAELAAPDPCCFTPALRQGIAPAMNAAPTRTYWGYELRVAWDEKLA